MPSNTKKKKKNILEMLRTATKDPTFLNHAWTNNHSIDFENPSVIDKSDHRVRKTHKSWHTAMTNEADNISMPLPRQ